jgi:uncharacterized protein (TIGR01319 family)
VLLTGGTDGGDRKTICHNARLLCGIGLKNIIVAGNKSAYDELQDIFSTAAEKTASQEKPAAPENIIFTKNVMPEFGNLDIEPVNEKIRELFIKRITEAKGIAKAADVISGVIMPTPSAVLEAAKLLADGAGDEPGIGELLLVDVGGATTDVYSIAAGKPSDTGVSLIGLTEPYAKRTVEGDLGLYHNLDALAELCAREGVLNAHLADSAQSNKISDSPVGANCVRPHHTDLSNRLRVLRESSSVPSGESQTRDQLALARLAVSTAVGRHAGRLERRVTHNGVLWVQKGKDLSGIKTVIGAGGPLAYSADPRYVLQGAVVGNEPSAALRPRSPSFCIDRRYIMFAVGLLSISEPVIALRIMKKYLAHLF